VVKNNSFKEVAIKVTSFVNISLARLNWVKSAEICRFEAGSGLTAHPKEERKCHSKMKILIKNASVG